MVRTMYLHNSFSNWKNISSKIFIVVFYDKIMADLLQTEIYIDFTCRYKK